METNFSRYVDLKMAQHASAINRAKRDREACRHSEHARHLANAATVRVVLAADLRDYRPA